MNSNKCSTHPVTKEIPEFLGALCQDQRWRPKKYLLSDNITGTYFSLWKLLQSPHPCSGPCYLVAGLREVPSLFLLRGPGESQDSCPILGVLWSYVVCWLKPMSQTPHLGTTDPSSLPVWVDPEKPLPKAKWGSDGEEDGLLSGPGSCAPYGAHLCDFCDHQSNGDCAVASPEGTVSMGANEGLLTHEQNCFSHQLHLVTSESLG